MDNYLFLDIDGVLNSERTLLAYGKFKLANSVLHDLIAKGKSDPLFDPISVKLLQEAQRICNFKIVISSSWRVILNVSRFHDMFDYYNWDTRDIIIGKTGNENGVRGLQIKSWLDNNATWPYQYVIIDDSTDMLPEQMNNFVNTKFSDGITYEDFNKILQIFGQSNNSYINKIFLPYTENQE